MSIYSPFELEQLGFKHIGSNVHISRKASFYGIERISIGNHVRIDDFCVISAGNGGIYLGNYIHIAVHSTIIGAGTVRLADYCNISARVSIYSSNDDYSGEYMTNPMIDPLYTNVQHDSVTLEKHVVIGASSVVLPGVTINEGSAIGALSLVNNSVSSWGVYAGQPVTFRKKRKQGLLLHEQAFIATVGGKL